MKYVWLTLNWLASISSIVLAIGFFFFAPLVGLPWLLIALVFFPPIQNGKIPPKIKGVAAFILFLVFCAIFLSVADEKSEKRRADAAVESRTLQAKKLRLRIEDFNARRTEIIAVAQLALSQKQYQEVLTSTADYADRKDAELDAVRASASKELAAIRDASRMKEILAKLATEKDAHAIHTLYLELSQLAPNDPKIAKKLEAAKKEKEKVDAALAEAAAAVAKQAEIREKLDRQISGWDGSHIKLTRWIKESMNDPHSYEHVKTEFKRNQNGLLIHTIFRGKNAFGGLIRNGVWAESDLDGNIVKIIKSGAD